MVNSMFMLQDEKTFLEKVKDFFICSVYVILGLVFVCFCEIMFFIKKIKKHIFILCMFLSFTCSYNHVHIKQIPYIDHEYKILKQEFPWLNNEIYEILVRYGIYNRIDPVLMMCIIQYESGNACNNNYEKMLRVHSRSNAIGICQIMWFHSKDNPKKLYDPEFNVKIGYWYYKQCMLKAKKQGWKNWIVEANRMYNQGLNGERWRYRNWKNYAYPIYYKYKKIRSLL